MNVNLDVFKNNINIVREKSGKGVEIIPVLKADAYGHGLLEIARSAMECGCSRVAVSRVEEAVKLRESGINNEIIILYYISKEDIKKLFYYELTPSISNRGILEELIKYASLKKKRIRAHIAIDTAGMSNLGINEQEYRDLQDVFWNNPYITITGLFTHFVYAYSNCDSEFFKQKKIFDRCIKMIPLDKRAGVTVHAASSPAFLKYDDVEYDALRLATILYGIPIPHCILPPGIETVAEIKSVIADIKKVTSGKPIPGYCNSYLPSGDISIAVVPAGYGDFWWLNRACCNFVLVGNKRAQVIGTPYMDRMLVDVTPIKNIDIGDEVVLLGGQGNEKITIEEICERCNIDIASSETVVFPYSRVPRVFTHSYSSKVSQHILQDLQL
ncbi:MAG: alanine racemase [Acetivibrionales bacterium]|jgi:alanine racemase